MIIIYHIIYANLYISSLLLQGFNLSQAVTFITLAFGTPASMTKAVKEQEVDGILIDNYALTRFSNLMEKEPFRVERTIEHPITYGLVLPSGSPNTEQCVRRYMRNFNHEIFERIAKHLIPIKVSPDVNLILEPIENETSLTHYIHYLN